MIKKFLVTLSNPPQTVSTIKARQTAWQPSISSVGSIVAINGANLSAEVAGIVDTINFTSGEDVPPGTLLLTLRPNNDAAVLAQLRATAALDATNYSRDTSSSGSTRSARRRVDADHANLAAAQAQVEAQQALMAEKVVKAPFAGRLGIRQVDIGQYLSRGTQIVTLQQLNRCFSISICRQQALAQISVGQAVTVSVDAFTARASPAKSPRSTRPWTSRPAPCRCARRCRTTR